MRLLNQGIRNIAARLGIDQAWEDSEEAAQDAYESHHWGHKHDGTTFTDDHPDAPAVSTEMGKLLALGVIPIGKRGTPDRRAAKAMHHWEKRLELNPEKVPGEDEGIAELWFNGRKDPRCIVSFTPASELLHLALPPDEQKRMQAYFRSAHLYPLGELAGIRGGRAAEGDERQVPVALLGELAWVMYLTDKKGDGVSEYVHGMGTEGRLTPMRPYLCVAEDGSLWLAGGNYEVKSVGISG
jgi:hypothetical protein